MQDISRRNLLAGSAAAAALATTPAMAAAPAAGVQSPGVYRQKIGSFEVTALYDGTWFRKIDDKFVRNAGPDQVNKALSDSFLQPGIVPTSFTALLVNTGSKLVLIDAGTGGQLGPTTGHMPGALAAAGVKPEAIDTIAISHFHPDHINGIKDKDGKKVFANAEIHVPAPEWAYWMDDANMSAAPEAMRPLFLNARRIFRDIAGEVKRFEPGKDVAARHQLDRRLRPHAGPYCFRGQLGQSVDAGAKRHHQSSMAVRAQSGMAGHLRHGRPDGGGQPQAPARPRRRRPDAGRRLSLPVPGDGLHRQDRHAATRWCR